MAKKKIWKASEVRIRKFIESAPIIISEGDMFKFITVNEKREKLKLDQVRKNK